MDAKRTHDIEQAAAGLAEFAIGLAGYFGALQREGFTREEAFALVKQYQSDLFRPRPE